MMPCRPSTRLAMLLAVVWLAVPGSPIAADADLIITTVAATGGTATLSSPTGVTQRVVDRDGDGLLFVAPDAGSGRYELTLEAAGASETLSVDVPRVGTLSILFDPAAPEGRRTTVETISRVEIINVTALKRDQELQNVAASVQALTAETIEEVGAVDFTDYARLVPAMNFADLGPNRNEINLRGLGKLTAGTATVGLYIDDVAVADSFNNPDLKLFDVERVEVLRGPQGTLYGEATMGGAIRLLTTQAQASGFDYKFDGTISSTSHGGDNSFGNVMVNAPLVRDRLGLRLVGFSHSEDGWIDNPVLGLQELNDADVDGGRMSLRWFPSDRAIVTLNGTVQDTEVGGQNFTTEGLGDLQQFTSLAESDLEDYSQINLNITYSMSWAELVSITGYVDRGYDRVIDFGIPVDFFSDQKIVSQEVRLASAGGNLDWVGGVYYKKWDQDNSLIARDLFGPGVDFGNFVEFNTENLSLFGEVTRYFNDKLSGTLGARIFDEEKNDPFTQTIGGVPFDESDLSSDASDVLPKLALAYDARSNVKLYVSYAEGYRSGGVNPIVTLNPEAPATYDEDSNTSLELGVRSLALDNRLSFNAALFRVDWNDMQISGTPDNSALGYTTNAGDAHTQGLELELNARAFPGFDVIVGATLLEAELDDPAEDGAAGNRLPHTVEESFNLGLQYQFAVGTSLTAVARGDLMYRGDGFSDVRNRVIDATGSYTLGNVRFGVEADRWGVYLFWNNVGDERAELVRFGDGLNVYRNQPETVGLTLRVKR